MPYLCPDCKHPIGRHDLRHCTVNNCICITEYDELITMAKLGFIRSGVTV